MDIVEQLRAAPENGAYLDIFLEAASEIERLRAENESLASNLRGKHATTGATYAHLIAERDNLRDENAKLRERAERYQWLRTQHSINDPLAAVVWKRGSDRRSSEWANMVDAADLDSHIDAAMREGK